MGLGDRKTTWFRPPFSRGQASREWQEGSGDDKKMYRTAPVRRILALYEIEVP